MREGALRPTSIVMVNDLIVIDGNWLSLVMWHLNAGACDAKTRSLSGTMENIWEGVMKRSLSSVSQLRLRVQCSYRFATRTTLDTLPTRRAIVCSRRKAVGEEQ